MREKDEQTSALMSLVLLIKLICLFLKLSIDGDL